MGKAIEIKWITPPSTLSRAYQAYGRKVIVAIKALADQIATEAQNQMRQNAPWKDRTGNARAALFSMAEQASESLVILYLSHGSAISYGLYLETSHGMVYAVIVPTMQKIFPKLMLSLNNLMG